jgi:dolichyl-phosphate-mannose-protein mannosyltransferase
VMTPCYTPYPRLILPWLLASWMGTAIAWDALAAMLFDAPPAAAPRHRFVKVILVAAGGASLLAGVGGFLVKQLSGDIRPSADRRGLMQIARQIHVDGPTETQPSVLPVTRAICVYGEPGLFFQLNATGEPLVLVVDSVPSGPVVIEGRRLPTYLAIGPHALADEGFLEQWAAASPQWELVEDYPHRPSRVVWYDLFDPLHPDAERQERLRRVQLYRLRR